MSNNSSDFERLEKAFYTIELLVENNDDEEVLIHAFEHAKQELDNYKSVLSISALLDLIEILIAMPKSSCARLSSVQVEFEEAVQRKLMQYALSQMIWANKARPSLNTISRLRSFKQEILELREYECGSRKLIEPFVRSCFRSLRENTNEFEIRMAYFELIAGLYPILK